MSAAIFRSNGQTIVNFMSILVSKPAFLIFFRVGQILTKPDLAGLGWAGWSDAGQAARLGWAGQQPGLGWAGGLGGGLAGLGWPR